MSARFLPAAYVAAALALPVTVYLFDFPFVLLVVVSPLLAGVLTVRLLTDWQKLARAAGTTEDRHGDDAWGSCAVPTAGLRI